MIAANHPALGMSPGQSGASYGFFRPYNRPIPPPPPAAAAPPAVNQITPPPAPAPAPAPAAPEPLARLSPATATLPETPTVPVTTVIVTPEVPASASATGSAAPGTTANTFDDFLNWLTEETVYSGVPNGAILAGGVILASLMFGGRKKGRR